MASSQTLFEARSTSNPSHTFPGGFDYTPETIGKNRQAFSTRPIQKASAGNSWIRTRIRPPDSGSNIGNAKSLHNNVAGSKRKEPSFHRSPSEIRQSSTMKYPAPQIRLRSIIQRHLTNQGQLTPSPAARAHYRESSLTSSDPYGPVSRYTQSTLERQVAGDSYHDFDDFQHPPWELPERIIREPYVFDRPSSALLANNHGMASLERHEGPRNRRLKKYDSTGTECKISSISFMKSTISKDRTPGESACQATLLAEFAQNSQKRQRCAFHRLPRSSSTLSQDPRALPLQQIVEGPTSMSPSMASRDRNYSPSLDGLSPKYLQDSADLVELPPSTTTGDMVARKPIGPRQSKVTSGLASRRPRRAGSPAPSPFKLISRSSLELDNTAREHPLYHNVTPKADGLYHCPFEDDPRAGCTHKPEKLKCNYDKFVDSHLKPYKCKVSTCGELGFSSTACLLRHEREAHAMHGHGDKPFLCTYNGCERGLTGNGFPRHWNLRDHLKRVHNDPGKSPKSSTSGSPPPCNLFSPVSLSYERPPITRIAPRPSYKDWNFELPGPWT